MHYPTFWLFWWCTYEIPRHNTTPSSINQKLIDLQTNHGDYRNASFVLVLDVSVKIKNGSWTDLKFVHFLISAPIYQILTQACGNSELVVSKTFRVYSIDIEPVRSNLKSPLSRTSVKPAQKCDFRVYGVVRWKNFTFSRTARATTHYCGQSYYTHWWNFVHTLWIIILPGCWYGVHNVQNFVVENFSRSGAKTRFSPIRRVKS